MEGSTFDRMTANLGRASRRGVVGAAVAGLLALPKAMVGRASSCPRGRARCGNTCCKAVETCKRGRCVHHCKDDKKNKGETDKDCGGTCRNRKRCPILANCKVDTDCKSGVCVGIAAVPDVKVCMHCRANSDCRRNSPSRPVCRENFCWECQADADCDISGRPADQFCVVPVSECCIANEPCFCRECRNNDDCPEDRFCDEDNRCIARENPCAADEEICLAATGGCDAGCSCAMTVDGDSFCHQGTALSTVGCLSDGECAHLPENRCIRTCDLPGGPLYTVCAQRCGCCEF